tara:strand:- start:1104 stop:1247 length:144 start_codon:yes stop_codon:yes gene_type:complete
MVAVVIPMKYVLNHVETGLGEMRGFIRVQMLLSFTGDCQQSRTIQYK